MTVPLPEDSAAAYAWPPLPVPDPDQAAAILAERLGHAFDDLEAERLHVATAAGLGRRDLVDVFLREFQASIIAFLAAVDGDVTEFIRKHLGPRYEEGVLQAISGDVTWTAPHVAALTSLATDTYADFLARAHEAERVSEKFVRAVRDASARELPKIAAGGRTATQAADRLEERLVTEYDITEVTYRDGSRVPVRAYAHMAARTKSAVAFNAGTLNGCVEAGVGWVEVFDGPSCGWKFHDDEDLATRSIRTVTDAGRYAISHPNCRRAFGPRPDITTAAEAATAEPFTTEEQHADAVEQERLNELRQARRRTRPAVARRARLAVKRQARRQGATSTDQVADIIRTARTDRGLDAVPPAPAPDPVEVTRDDYYRWADALVDGMSSEDRYAVDRYVGQAYSRINPVLRRGGELDDHDRDIVDRLTRIVGSQVTEQPMWAYRGVDDAAAVLGADDLTGKVISDGAFMSLTTDQGLARSFRSTKRGATIEVLIPGGSRVAAINTRELELLAQRGSKLRVLREYRDLDEHRHIVATLEQP